MSAFRTGTFVLADLKDRNLIGRGHPVGATEGGSRRQSCFLAVFIILSGRDARVYVRTMAAPTRAETLAIFTRRRRTEPMRRLKLVPGSRRGDLPKDEAHG